MRPIMEKLEWRDNGGDEDGNTPLHFAAASGKQKVLFDSLTVGCEINAVNNMGWTPLMQAARNGHWTCVKLLLDFGADVSIKNYFATSGSLEAVSLILKSYIEKGIPVIEVEKDFSPLFFAVIFNKIDILRYFHKYSYNLKQTLPWLGDFTPVLAAHILKNKELLSYFKRRGIKMAVNVQSPLVHSHSPNVQFFKSTPSSCKQYSLTPNYQSLDIPSVVFNSPASSNDTPFNTPKFNTFLSPNSSMLKVKKRKSSNFCASPIPVTPSLSPIIYSNMSYHSICSHSAKSNHSNSKISHDISNHAMNSRINMSPQSLTFSSTSSNDSSMHSLHQKCSRTKNTMHRCASYNAPNIPDVTNSELTDDVFVNSIQTNINHKFVELLRRHSLDSCIPLFEKHEIDMKLFLTLSKSDLGEIGVNSDDRDAILEVINKCNKNANRKRKM